MSALSNPAQVRGKKNLVIEKSLAGPIGLIVKVSTLQDYGVDKFFFLENKNADTSQRNVVFVARGECARHAQSIAGQPPSSPSPSPFFTLIHFPFEATSHPAWHCLQGRRWGQSHLTSRSQSISKRERHMVR